jgi:CRISPR system Cascade subunit CasD
VLRLEPPDDAPTLNAVAAHLRAPKRPLFVGRKPCLPSRPILSEPPIEAANVLEALRRASIVPPAAKPSWHPDAPDLVRLVLPSGEWPRDREHRCEAVADVRDWIAGVHAGETWLDLTSLERSAFPPLDREALP